MSDVFLEICRGERQPPALFYNGGKKAHAEGKQFHECEMPFESAAALSWRLGWNDAALAARD